MIENFKSGKADEFEVICRDGEFGLHLYWLDSDFTPRKSQKSKIWRSNKLFEILIKNSACMRNLSPWMHA